MRKSEERRNTERYEIEEVGGVRGISGEGKREEI